MKSASANNSLKWKFCSSENGLKLHEILYLSRDCSHRRCFSSAAFLPHDARLAFFSRVFAAMHSARTETPRAFPNGIVTSMTARAEICQFAEQKGTKPLRMAWSVSFSRHTAAIQCVHERVHTYSRIHARIKDEPKVVTFRKSFAFSFITISACTLSCWRKSWFFFY